MSQATKQQISSAKSIIKPELYTKLIACPSHSGAHSAVLYCFGHKHAGIWECPVTGDSESHEHGNYEIEDTITDFYNPNDEFGHGQFEGEIYVCGGPEGCGVTIQDADPVLERLEVQAEL